jgi:hypothetical protein
VIGRCRLIFSWPKLPRLAVGRFSSQLGPRYWATTPASGPHGWGVYPPGCVVTCRNSYKIDHVVYQAPARAVGARLPPGRYWFSAAGRRRSLAGWWSLLQKGKAVAYYNTAGASVGLQAGAQQYGYAMFFMNANALAQLDEADGFEVGVGPTVVMVDQGMAKTITTTTMKDDIYAFIFGQRAGGGTRHSGQQDHQDQSEIDNQPDHPDVQWATIGSGPL